MDAISFGLGERIQSVRMEGISYFIHGAAIIRPISRSAWATAVFILGNWNEVVTVKEKIDRQWIKQLGF